MGGIMRALNRFQLFRLMRDNPALRWAAFEELQRRPNFFVTRDETRKRKENE